MVQSVNEKERKILIEMCADVEDLYYMQTSIIELLKKLDYGNHGNDCEGIIHYTLTLLGEIMPDLNTQIKGYKAPEHFIELPADCPPESVQAMREAVYLLKSKGSKVYTDEKAVRELIKNKL